MLLELDEEEPETQVILRKPFLITSGILNDVLEGAITLRVRSEKVTLYMIKWNNQITQNTMSEPLRDTTWNPNLLIPI